VSKQVNAILSTKWQGNGENVLNPLLVFLLKLFSNRYGIEQIDNIQMHQQWIKYYRRLNVFPCPFNIIKTCEHILYTFTPFVNLFNPITVRKEF
jgi:hypothetical protein